MQEENWDRLEHGWQKVISTPPRHRILEAAETGAGLTGAFIAAIQGGGSEPILPALRIAPSAKARDDQDILLRRGMDQALGIAPQQRAPRGRGHDRECFGAALHGRERGDNGAHRPRAEAWPPDLMPIDRFASSLSA